MPGLLDNPKDAAMLQLGLGLLSRSGPSRMPVSIGQALGDAGQEAMGTYQQVGQNQQLMQMREMQMQQQRMQAEEMQKRQAALQQFRSQLPPPLQAQFDADPQTFIKSLYDRQKTAEPKLVTVMTPNGPMQKWMRPGESQGVDIGAPVDTKKPDTPFYQFLPTESGYAVGNARTGQIAPGVMAGAPVIKASDSPKLQAEITKAKETAKAGVEKDVAAGQGVKKSNQFLETAKQAEALLNQNPTESGAGAAIDVAGRVVGMSRKSSQVASQLEAVSGWLVANVPRMEGPQSNFDVANYQTMAGKIGDRTVPIAERKAALKEVIRLQEKYKKLNEDSMGSAPERSVVRRGKYNGKTVVEYSDGSVEYAD